MIDAFLDSSSTHLAELRAADGATAASAAHRLCGAARNLAAQHLAALCAQAERLAAGGASLPPPLLEQVAQERAAVCAELAHVRAGRT